MSSWKRFKQKKTCVVLLKNTEKNTVKYFGQSLCLK